MKSKIFIFLFLLITNAILGQQNIIDSLKTIINLQRGDTNEVKALLNLANVPGFTNAYKVGVFNIDSSNKYLLKGLLLAKNLNYTRGEAYCYLLLSVSNGNIGNYGQAISFMLKALHIYEQLKDEDGIAATHLSLQGLYRGVGDFKNSLSHAFSVKRLVEINDRKGTIFFPGIRMTPLVLSQISSTYLKMDKLDSAVVYVQKAIKEKLLINGAHWNYPIHLLGKIQDREGKYSLALKAYRSAIPLAIQNEFPKDTADIYNSISTLYKKTGKLDSAIYYAKEITNNWNYIWPVEILLDANTTLAEVYKLKGNRDSTLKYIELRDVLKDSIYSQGKQREVQSVIFNEQLRQQEILSAQAENRNKIRVYILVGGLIVLLLIAGILWRNNRHRQKAYALLEKQKQETDHQKGKVEQTLEELKSTQKQLIQSEKMASLGELTAGIAHEIQNPLNFVNNFSDVNKELLIEMKDEMNKGNLKDANEIANDVIDNEEKISHHGKRADAIVKNMLQHSRSSSGAKEPTDINALADEYLRLAYHGLRAKDKSFNADIKTDFDNRIGKINIISQDMGRVVLNLINNAFYAVDEKKKQIGDGYEPTVSVSTKKIEDKVEIKVSDNGNGISSEILDKIFQPFFTTKPTGQGTGLGLSLSYDIVKAHSGELKVDTTEGEGSKFTIQLPVY